MLLYKCDGESYSTRRKCSNEVPRDLPEWWLTFSGKIKNGLHDAHYIEANGTYHFCSRRCLENFLFKDVNPASGITGVNHMIHDPKEQQEEVKAPATETEQEQVPGEVLESADESGEE